MTLYFFRPLRMRITEGPVGIKVSLCLFFKEPQEHYQAAVCLCAWGFFLVALKALLALLCAHIPAALLSSLLTTQEGEQRSETERERGGGVCLLSNIFCLSSHSCVCKLAEWESETWWRRIMNVCQSPDSRKLRDQSLIYSYCWEDLMTQTARWVFSHDKSSFRGRARWSRITEWRLLSLGSFTCGERTSLTPSPHLSPPPLTPYTHLSPSAPPDWSLIPGFGGAFLKSPVPSESGASTQSVAAWSFTCNGKLLVAWFQFEHSKFCCCTKEKRNLMEQGRASKDESFL